MRGIYLHYVKSCLGKIQTELSILIFLFGVLGALLPEPRSPAPTRADPPQEANLRESTQLSCRCSWYFSGLRTCRISTLLLSMPTASQSWLGQWPREKIWGVEGKMGHQKPLLKLAASLTEGHPRSPAAVPAEKGSWPRACSAAGNCLANH